MRENKETDFTDSGCATAPPGVCYTSLAGPASEDYTYSLGTTPSTDNLEKSQQENNFSLDLNEVGQFLASLANSKCSYEDLNKKEGNEESKLMNDFLAKLLLEKEEKRFKSLEERRKSGGRRDIFDEFGSDETDTEKLKRDAMSQFQEDKAHHKRSTNYGDLNQWDYLNQQDISGAANHGRRGHYAFGGSSQAHSGGWNPLGMGLPRQANPYFSNPHGHVMPAHAHSTGRYNQWNNPGSKNLPNINNAHSQNSVLSQSRMDGKHRPDIGNSISGFMLPGGHVPDLSKIRSNPRDMLRNQHPDKSSSRSTNMPSDHHASMTPPIRNSNNRPPSLSAPTKAVISNPLSDLQMLVKNQENEKACSKTDFYQQESVDLSAHSDSSKQKANLVDKVEKPISENNTNKEELRPSVSVVQAQNNNVSNRVEEVVVLDEDEDGDGKAEAISNDKPVELTSKNSEKVTRTSISSSVSIIGDNKKLENHTDQVLTENVENSETVAPDKNNKSSSSVIVEKSDVPAINNGNNDASCQEPINAIGKIEKVEHLVSDDVKEKEYSIKTESKSPEEANETNNKRKAPVAEQPGTEIKKVCLNDESQIENKEDVAGAKEESSDMPTVSSTSAEVRPSLSDTGKKTPKKKPNRKSRGFRPSSGLSSSSESQFYSKKFRTSTNKDEVKKKGGKKGLCDSVDRRGPFLHVEGSKDSPTMVTVINFPKGDDEDERDKSAVKSKTLNLSRTKHHNELDYRGKTKNSLFSSTLSSRYDAHTTDRTWICVFCKKEPHYNSLGDLFGPYIISKDENASGSYCDYSGDEKDISDAQKRGGRNKKSLRANNMVDHFQKMSKKLRRTQSSDSPLTGMTVISSGDETEQIRYEVWVHEQCAIWAPNVCLIGSRIMGMQEAIWSSVRTTCSKCGASGANIGCVFRNCPNRSHYHCAKENDWSLEQETFISTCQVHKPRS